MRVSFDGLQNVLEWIFMVQACLRMPICRAVAGQPGSLSTLNIVKKRKAAISAAFMGLFRAHLTAIYEMRFNHALWPRPNPLPATVKYALFLPTIMLTPHAYP
jgi:hypothetical protein